MCMRISRITIKHLSNYIHSGCGPCNIVGVGGCTHRKQEPSIDYILFHLPCYKSLHLRNFQETQFCRKLFVDANFLLIPGHVLVGTPEFSKLSGKIFMVKMKPVVFCQLTVQNFLVVNFIIIYFSVCKYEGNGI